MNWAEFWEKLGQDPGGALTMLRESVAEWLIQAGEGFAKWLGETIPIVLRDPQAIAIVLLTGLVAGAVVVVFIRAIWRVVFVKILAVRIKTLWRTAFRRSSTKSDDGEEKDSSEESGAPGSDTIPIR